MDDELRERLSRNLETFSPKAVAADGLRHAAVVVALAADERGTACFLLTRRASKLRDHGGQIALPGGRVEPGEAPAAAALRELDEELGLRAPSDAVIGALDDYATRSGFRITPVVAWVGGSVDLVPNPAEVAEAYRVPLEALDAPDSPRLIEIPESDRPVIQMPIYGRYVHAPTAAILYQLREVALHGRHTPVAHFEQPVWAWR